MTITLSPDLEARIKQEAARQGLDPNDYATRLIADHLPPVPGTQTLAELFAQWAEEDRTDDPAELARRQKDYEEFQAAMNRNRLEAEGPGARKVYP